MEIHIAGTPGTQERRSSQKTTASQSTSCPSPETNSQADFNSHSFQLCFTGLGVDDPFVPHPSWADPYKYMKFSVPISICDFTTLNVAGSVVIFYCRECIVRRVVTDRIPEDAEDNVFTLFVSAQEGGGTGRGQGRGRVPMPLPHPTHAPYLPCPPVPYPPHYYSV